MNQKRLEVAIRSALIDMLSEQQITLPVIAGFPPNKQGRVDDGIYFFLIGRIKHGWQGRMYVDDGDDLINHESQINGYQFQFQAFVEDNGLSDGQLLAEDVLATVRGVMQSIKFVDLMQAQGIGVQRATDILSPNFVNDRDNFEHNPNFTIIFSHLRTIHIKTPKVTQFKQETTSI